LPFYLDWLNQYISEGVILSTCNRLEVHTFDKEPDRAVNGIKKFLVDYSSTEETEIASHLYQYHGVECVSHLFSMAGGLDSMIIGEQGILAQMRTAFRVASHKMYAQGYLARLFHHAFRVGRRIQRETGIADSSRSVSHAGVQLAQRILGDFPHVAVLVIGAGEAGRLVAQALASRGIKDIMVTNRTPWRAVELARELGGRAVLFEDLPQQLATVDAVISSTGAPDYVLDRTIVEQATRHRQGSPLLLIDLAVPRDIDPAAGQLEQVLLYDMDTLQSVAECDRYKFSQELTRAESIVKEETDEFLLWWSSLDTTSLIASIRAQADRIRKDEMGKTLRRLEHQALPDLTPHLDALTSALVSKLLHYPTMQIKQGLNPEYRQLVRQLFSLDGGTESNGCAQSHQNR
jgi:glutamyl-tRNA reductase